MYNVRLRRVHATIFAVKAISSTYIECVFVALVIRHTTCMHHITLSSVAFQLYSIFPRYLLTASFSGKRLLNIKCVFIFFTNSVGNISHCTKNSARYYNKCIHLSSCQEPVILVIFY